MVLVSTVELINVVKCPYSVTATMVVVESKESVDGADGVVPSELMVESIVSVV